ncbi:MAG TPA: chromate transporter, partial [Burkholderiales bacterium]|nr:chromate transporter [Burkholderiales bacterium]
TALSAGFSILFPWLWMQMLIIAAGGLSGLLFLDAPGALPREPVGNVPTRKTGLILLSAFFFLLAALPLVVSGSGSYPLRLFDSFYRAGALVFGGGHVVLPLLQSQVVPNGWVSNSEFLAGYGAAQAVPGPLFTFSAFLGAVSSGTPSGWAGASIALFAIFLPSFLLVSGILPFWEDLRRVSPIQRAMKGINAAVLGLLIAAFWSPVCTTAIRGEFDIALAAASFLMLLKLPSCAVVISTVMFAGITHL